MSTFPLEEPAEPAQLAEPAVPHASIVLPCFNEEQHVLLEVERICAAMDKSGIGYELLAIDDGSTDQTLARLRRAEPDFPNLKVIHFPRNGGAGTVRRIGSQQARGDIVVWTDADLTYPNERIPEFVTILDEDPTIDQVVGARTSEEGTLKIFRVPAKWFVRKLAERLTNADIPDLNSGLRAFRRTVARPYLRLLPPGFSCVQLADARATPGKLTTMLSSESSLPFRNACLLLLYASVASAGVTDLFPPAEMRDRVSLELKISPPVAYASKLSPGRTLQRIDLTFTSFEWAGEKWRHPCMVLLPDRTVQEFRGAAAIIAGNGSNPDGVPFSYAEAAALMGIPTLAIIGADPGPHYGGKNEGAVMAVMQAKFLATGDPHWIGYAALGKVIIRAITAMQAVPGVEATRFVVTGGSKRGVASWVAAGADDRIVGAYPEAWNLANFEAQLQLEAERLGPDYGKDGGAPGSESPRQRLAMLATPRGREYQSYLDPYLWRDRIANKPILFTVGTNDPLFPTPGDRVFLPDMPKSTRILFIPNYGHGHETERNFAAWRMWLAHVFADRPVPEATVSWQRRGDRLELTAAVHAANPVKTVTSWSASQVRGNYLECRWNPTPLAKGKDGYSAALPAPIGQFTVFYVEIEDEDPRWGRGVISTGTRETN